MKVKVLLGLLAPVAMVASLAAGQGVALQAKGSAGMCEGDRAGKAPCANRMVIRSTNDKAVVKSGALGVFLAPAGTVYAESRYPCEYLSSGFLQSFVVDFTTNPATSYLKISWTGQAEVQTGPSIFEGVALDCTITQAGVTQYCPATDDWPWVVRRDATGEGMVSPASYIGTLAPLLPNVATNVTINFWNNGAVGRVCYQNLRLEY